MKDQYNREINYMRISITDRCNLRCRYCMPKDAKLVAMKDILTFEEIVTVVENAVGLGIVDYKITGGEPLVRKDFPVLLSMIKSVPGVRQVTITTNGILLSKYAETIFKAGVKQVNVSLDTVDAKSYMEITGMDQLHSVKNGIEAGLRAGLLIKLNAVAYSVENVLGLAEYAQNMGIALRFIELMPIGFGKAFQYISNAEIMKILEAQYGKGMPSGEIKGNGPAVYYRFEGLKTPIGFISAIHNKFCAACNRVRLTAEGLLKSCLCYDKGVDLRPYLRDEELSIADELKSAIYNKPMAHCFEKPENITEENGMSRIGG